MWLHIYIYISHSLDRQLDKDLKNIMHVILRSRKELHNLALWHKTVDITHKINSKSQTSFEPRHDKTNKLDCVPSGDSDQPGDPPCLIRGFTVHMKKAWVLTYPLSALRRLWSDWADAMVEKVSEFCCKVATNLVKRFQPVRLLCRRQFLDVLQEVLSFWMSFKRCCRLMTSRSSLCGLDSAMQNFKSYIFMYMQLYFFVQVMVILYAITL